VDPNRLPDVWDCLGLLRQHGWAVREAPAEAGVRLDASRGAEARTGLGALAGVAAFELVLACGLWPPEGQAPG
jgi:hypothetical protein